MTREGALRLARPILFNTDMVRAILDRRKKVTRRVVKYKYCNTEMKMRTDKYGTRLIEIQKDTMMSYMSGRRGVKWRLTYSGTRRILKFKIFCGTLLSTCRKTRPESSCG